MEPPLTEQDEVKVWLDRENTCFFIYGSIIKESADVNDFICATDPRYVKKKWAWASEYFCRMMNLSKLTHINKRRTELQTQLL